MNSSTAPVATLNSIPTNPTHPKSSFARNFTLRDCDPSITGTHPAEEMEEKVKCQQNSRIDQFLTLEQCFLGCASPFLPTQIDRADLVAQRAISRTYPADLTKLTAANSVGTSGAVTSSGEGSSVQITGFQQFLEILTVPDNIPIIAMMILVMFFTYIALKQARRNDQLIEHGHRERIIDEMRK